MAEEDLDLEDDDLDLGGDEFAGELDDMMGDDELGGGKPTGGGESGGGSSKGEDSDSELDSFFEDLSSIEDMDEGGSEASPTAAAAAAPKTSEGKAPAKAKKVAPKDKKKGGKLKYFILLLILLAGGSGAYYWFFMQHPMPIVDIVPEVEPPPIQPLELEKPVVKSMPIQPIIEIEPPPAPVKPAVPQKQFLVQVATCSYDVCKEDYTESLRMAGQPVFQRASGEKYDFIELVTSQVFSFREASELTNEINTKNKLAGKASVKPQSNGYRISMGSFPSLDRAKEIKLNIEQLFPSKNVTFNMEHVRRDYTTTKIYAGPYGSNSEARKVLMALKSSEKFKGAFIVLF
jgi:hypothetical protein